LIPQEIEQLAALLKKVATESEEGRPAGYIPAGCLKEFYKLAPNTGFLELVIWRKRDGKFEYFFQDRHDEHWDGFCAFGGMVRPNMPSDPVGIAQMILDREFRDLGILVESVRIVSVFRWPEHPWCNPFAIPALVRVSGNLSEIKGRWLSADDLPENIVPHHDTYLRQCENLLRTSTPLIFTPAHPNGL
jgi:hypothetical protein